MKLPAPGDVFEAKYTIHNVIGKGGFATVFRATDSEVGRDVALKILSPRDGGYPEAVVARFMREARLLAGLQDPHTITMFDFGSTDDGLLFMVFEYISGNDLSEILKRRERLPPDEVKHILKQVLYALREAHNAGVFHRDIKPANLLIYEYMGDPSCVKLIDFGVAKPVESHPMGPGNLTKKGAMVGTPRYMAPEQIYGKDLTAAADIYSLGLVAYEMLSGVPAMDGKTNKARVRQQLSSDPTLVPEEYGTRALRSVINRMIEKEPEDRYPTAVAALAALRSGQVERRPRKPAKTPTPPGNTSDTSDTIDESASPTTPVSRPNLYRILLIGLLTAGSGVTVLVAGNIYYSGARDDADAATVQLGDDDADVTPGGDRVAEAPAQTARRSAATPVAAEKAAKPAKVPTSGCGNDPTAVGLQDHELMLGLKSRPWLRYVPPDYDPSKRHPVVLLFHGMFSNPRRFLDVSGMLPLAEEKGFVVVAVQAATSAAEWKSVDNYEVVSKALASTKAEFCVDDQRIFALGHGRGGWFARDLGCYMPLSAIAITGSGQHVGSKVCRPLPPVPTLRIYGKSDPLVPANGGAGCFGGDYMSAAEINAEWVDRYRCSDRKPWLDHPNGTCVTWSCEIEHARYVSCGLAGGHEWPGGPPKLTTPNCESQPADFPYRDTIWRFFEEEGRTL